MRSRDVRCAAACACNHQRERTGPGRRYWRVDWLPWLALGGSVAALIGAEAPRRRASDAAQTRPTEAGIPFTAFVLYIVATLLAVLAIYLFVRRA
jgi:hypothetical protein